MRKALFRSTPFRLTVVLGVAFLAALLVAGATAFQLIRQELDARIDRNVLDTYTVISRSFGENDLTDLRDTVTSHASATLQHERVYLLRDQQGQVLAGNATIIPTGPGWSTVSAAAIGVTDGDDSYRIYVGDVGPYQLLVGSSFAETNAIGRLALTSIGWASGLFVAIVLTAGVVVAARGQRRLDGIADTMRRVGRGELSARIAVSGRNDDIDALVSDVNAALDRLAALVEGMRQVSVDIAHDLKTPLNRLAITIETAIEAAEKNHPTKALLLQARDESHQINATFDALLRIAQIEAGARRSRFRRLAPARIAEAIADAYGEVAEEKRQTLTLIETGPLTDINGDKDLLIQMLANLVENAIRHCPPGAAITLACRMHDERVEISVADTGPGIPATEHGNVFRRLYRLEKSRTTPGSGLGLSLVKAIAELHGATITLRDNRPGLVVDISFPPGEPVQLADR